MMLQDPLNITVTGKARKDKIDVKLARPGIHKYAKILVHRPISGCNYVSTSVSNLMAHNIPVIKTKHFVLTLS